MSSKIYSPATLPEEVAPIRWRMANQEAEGSGPSAGDPAELRPAQIGFQLSSAEIEARVEQAYQKGLAEGRQQSEVSAMQMANQQVTPVLQNFANAAREMVTAGARIRSENEAMMVQLAIAIAKRVLHREIQTDPEAILGLVRSAFDRLNSREVHKLRVAPGDAELIAQNRAALALPDALQVDADRTLAPGSAIFETARGELDASANTQLDEIQRGFADLVRRRSH